MFITGKKQISQQGRTLFISYDSRKKINNHIVNLFRVICESCKEFTRMKESFSPIVSATPTIFVVSSIKAQQIKRRKKHDNIFYDSALSFFLQQKLAHC
jgi:hypothetical protein